jgi:hypothetical protein
MPSMTGNTWQDRRRKVADGSSQHKDLVHAFRIGSEEDPLSNHHPTLP